MPKSTRVDIVELSPESGKRLLADKDFSNLSPAACDHCGNKTGFDRRIFKINGIPRENRSDKTEQSLLRHRFRTNPVETIENVFFRIHSGNLYADAAVCQRCKSTRVSYDLFFDDEKMTALAKAVGADPATFKAQVDALTKKSVKR